MSDGTTAISDVIESARANFERLAGRPIEAVSSVSQQESGWLFGFEVVELERVPDSTSLLGTYEVRADRDGNVLEYDRLRRYYRNRADEEA